MTDHVRFSRARTRAALLCSSLALSALPFLGAAHVSANTPAAHSAIPQGGTVIAAEADTPSALNPLLNQQLSTVDIDSAVFDSLVRIGDKGQFMPDLASSYTKSADGLSWVFHLNPKATWQDGKPFTSADVLYTESLVRNPAFGATSVLGFDHIKTIKAVGKYEVDITLTSRYAPFLNYYATGFILPQHILGSIAPDKIRTDSAYNTKPLGTGAFIITDVQKADHYTLSANKNYFLGAPHLDKLIFRIVPSNATVLSQLQTGEVTLAGQTANLDPRQFNVAKRVPSLKAYVSPGFNWQHLDVIETGFLKDVKVRQALQSATPRQRIIDVVQLGYGVPQYADQAPAKPYYDKAVTTYWPYNVAKAQTLLAADGFKKNSSGTLTKGGVAFNVDLYVDASSTSQLNAVQIIKNAWGQIGVNVTIRSLDPATLFGRTGPLYDPNRLKSSTMKVVDYEWIEGADPDGTFFWSSSNIVSAKIQAGGNFDGYSNPAVDKLLAQGLTATDQASRKAIYNKIQLILANDVPDVWLYWGSVLTVATSKLHGYDPNPFNYDTAWNAKDWYIQ